MDKRWMVGLAGIMLSLSVQALTLDEARSQGRAGETLDGFLMARTADSETQALVARINQQRAATYRQLALSNNLTPEDIARLAGQKLVARAQPGEYVRGINGLWMKK